MILHLALFTWRDDVDDAAVADLERALADMAGRLRMLRGYRCGPNQRVRPRPPHIVVAALVDDEQALAEYLDSAEHAEVYARHLSAMIETRQAAQLSVPAGATL